MDPWGTVVSWRLTGFRGSRSDAERVGMGMVVTECH
jgi:hypothetical protein